MSRRLGLACGALFLLTLACSGGPGSPCGTCSGQQVCLAVPIADGGVIAQCGALSQATGPCGPTVPAACDTNLECIDFGGATGVCYQLCDPASPTCASGLSCLSALSTPDAGICATPNSNGMSCDDSQQLFCAVGQVCLSPGTCFKRCDPTMTTNCPQLESCVTPSPFEPELSICVQPQPLGASCSPPTGVYCETGTFCVTLTDGGGSCLQDCSDGGVCPPTEICRSITNQDRTLVLGVCY
jgi:hypothetical protein